MNANPISLEDIAQKLGIAVSTVSRALRDLPGIHPATRAKIQQEAKALGYIAPSKRSSQETQPRNILTLTVGTEVPSSYLSGMSQASIAHNFSLLSYHFLREESLRLLDPQFQPPALRLGQVSAIVLIYPWPEEVAKMLSSKWPTASIVVQYPKLPIDVIDIDHVRGIFMLVEHLAQAGHAQIGFFGLNAKASWARSRFAAYMEALVTLELPMNLNHVINIPDINAMAVFPYRDKAIYDSVEKKIQQGVRAWVCADDIIANSLSAELLQRGHKIPEEVAITGFHRNIRPIPNLPDLTSTLVNEELMGASVLRRLAYRMDHPKEGPRRILFPCLFHQGETTRPISVLPDTTGSERGFDKA